MQCCRHWEGRHYDISSLTPAPDCFLDTSRSFVWSVLGKTESREGVDCRNSSNPPPPASATYSFHVFIFFQASAPDSTPLLTTNRSWLSKFFCYTSKIIDCTIIIGESYETVSLSWSWKKSNDSRNVGNVPAFSLCRHHYQKHVPSWNTKILKVL